MNTNLRHILATGIFMASLLCVEIRAVDYPLTTETKVDYACLKSGFANPPEESKLRCFWFWQYGVATKKSITLDLEAVEGHRLKLGDTHPHTLESWNNLIEIYESLNKPKKAEEWREKLPQTKVVD